MAPNDSNRTAIPTGDFRPVQYLGSKWRLLDAIEQDIAPLRHRTRPVVCDLFAGTGVVARRLASSGPVLAADVQEYSRVLTSAQLKPFAISPSDAARVRSRVRSTLADLNRAPVAALVSYEIQLLEDHSAQAELCDLVEYGSLAAFTWIGGQRRVTERLGQLMECAAQSLHDCAAHSVLTEHYGGVYYSYQQALALDAMVSVAHGLETTLKDTVLAAVLSTASELVASVGGHFAQPVRVRSSTGSIKHHSVVAIRASRRTSALDAFDRWLNRWTALPPASNTSIVVRQDFRDVLSDLPRDVGVIYADPPYTRDHYSRFYHVLETIALGDDPGLSTVRIGGVDAPSRGLYRQQRHQSPFSIVTKAPDALAGLSEALVSRQIPMVLSYSPVPETEKPRQRVMTMAALLKVLRENFSVVTVRGVDGIGHAKINARHLNTKRTYDAEVLITCRP